MRADRPAGGALALPPHLRLTALEELWAIPVGFDPRTEALGTPTYSGGPRAALERVVSEGLRRPPCLVSFSGGVDSSVVLALAVHMARREGLAPPIPITNRFPGVDAADETEWQERVVAHLGVSDWVRLEWDHELDMVGPVASTVLRRHGILVPFNSHFHYPLLERAAGGSLLSGIGGDELFESVSRAAAARVLIQRRRPRSGELRSLAFGVAPRRLRARIKAHTGRPRFARFRWILPVRRAELASAHAAWESRDPLRVDRALREWWWRSRVVQCNLAGKRVLAADFDVAMRHPFLDPDVLAACAQAGAASGLGRGSRTRGFGLLAGDLLPPEVLARRSKASFDGAFCNRHLRAFAASWDGAGLDPASVEPDALRSEWLTPAPDAHSFALLQRAWLASHT
jgi:asparagine synthetase B (glutamine-hydrolysing)